MTTEVAVAAWAGAAASSQAAMAASARRPWLVTAVRHTQPVKALKHAAPGRCPLHADNRDLVERQSGPDAERNPEPVLWSAASAAAYRRIVKAAAEGVPSTP